MSCSSCKDGLCPDNEGGFIPCTFCGRTYEEAIPFFEVHKDPKYELVPVRNDDLHEIRRCFWHYPFLRPDTLVNVTSWVNELYNSQAYDLVKIQEIDGKAPVWYGHFDVLGPVMGLHAYKPVDTTLNLRIWMRIGAMALDYSFKIWDVRKVMTAAPVDMIGYNKMIVMLGFQLEGRLREAEVYKGKPVDQFLYGILKHEFYGEGNDDGT